MTENTIDTDGKTFGEKLAGIEYTNRIGVYGIVINNEGKVATIKTSTGYFLPGGGVENGENYEQCIEREFLEETGYEVVIANYVGNSSFYHISKTNQYLHGIGYFYIVNLKCKTNSKTEEDHELLWIEPGECIKCLFLEHQAWAVSKTLI